ncbi:wax ester/triacylglycerol synthase family O-acyltransferase [Moritella marina ATCC 15381]|uniref:diacylglycerol O-acyltransferase n=1 Tax=Moritella marina ATCC 15381 TaxID=1202962 RepID=A0A5J6WGT8_MORMI|nr:wax ester/triacylglycerol synthase family O-acyltransferase [Moritella marina]QFI37283.1 wax ester/triacylglycerol synthase family O-acyltransferase [Moritella marina ATCC 15381]
MEALTLVDMGFLYTETVTSPKHVAGLQIFSTPENYQGNFSRDLFDNLMSQQDVKKPFNQKLKKQITGQYFWQEDDNIDLSYHVRFAMLPQPGNDNQLLSFVEHQHETLLDRSRPLWEMILIDGLADNKFAIYVKVHHAFTDGAKANQLLMAYLSKNAESQMTAFWSVERPQKERVAKSALTLLTDTSKLVSGHVKSIPSLTKLTTKLLFQATNMYKADMPTPFMAPKTPFSVSPKRARRAAMTSLPLARVKTLGRVTGATINDVVVTICDMAIHNYLETRNVVLKKPLVAQMPMSLRDASDKVSNNQVAISLVELAYAGERPLERLMTVKESCLKLKNETKQLSKEALTSYTLASQGLAAASELLNLDTILPPMGNVLISNVPGPSKALYMMGAKMDKCFPISVLPPGMSLNITLYSYNGSIHVGLVACRSALPDLTELADYIDDAFAALENEVLDCAIESVTDHIQLLSSSQSNQNIKQESIDEIANMTSSATKISSRSKVDYEDSRLCETA